MSYYSDQDDLLIRPLRRAQTLPVRFAPEIDAYLRGGLVTEERIRHPSVSQIDSFPPQMLSTEDRIRIPRPEYASQDRPWTRPSGDVGARFIPYVDRCK